MIIEKAANFIKNKKVKIISQDRNQIMIQVNDKIVTLKRKEGRVLDSCSCENHARFCRENPRCSHKIAACTFLCMKRIKW